MIGKPSDEKGIKKWNLWNSKKGLESKRAKELYIEKYKILAPKYAQESLIDFDDCSHIYYVPYIYAKL